MNSKERVIHVTRAIVSAAKKRGIDPHSISLVAVSKTKSVIEMEDVAQALQEEGRPVLFGENYVQEFKGKAQSLHKPYEAHCIGSLQRNKAKDAVRLFSWIQTVDSVPLLNELAKEAKKAEVRPSILFQVNISDDEAKGGVNPESLKTLIGEYWSVREALDWRGLMTVTRHYEKPEDARNDYRALRTLADKLLCDVEIAAHFSGTRFELSMGMSGDYEIAIEEGATIIRVGTALFGERVLA